MSTFVLEPQGTAVAKAEQDNSLQLQRRTLPASAERHSAVIGLQVNEDGRNQFPERDAGVVHHGARLINGWAKRNSDVVLHAFVAPQCIELAVLRSDPFAPFGQRINAFFRRHESLGRKLPVEDLTYS